MAGREQRTTQARILDAALNLFAEHGYRGTTVRQIATRADVSPALVIHHFGSKEGLRAAVNEDVATTIKELIEQYPLSDAPLKDQFIEPEESFRALFIDRPELGGYLRRLLYDGDDAGVELFRRFVQLSRQLSSTYENRGLMRVAPDPEMRDIQLIFLEIAVVLFQPLLDRYFGKSALSEEIHVRWLQSEFDLFTRGLFVVVDESGSTERE